MKVTYEKISTLSRSSGIRLINVPSLRNNTLYTDSSAYLKIIFLFLNFFLSKILGNCNYPYFNIVHFPLMDGDVRRSSFCVV